MHPLWAKGSRCPLHSILPVIPSPTSSSRQGEAGVDLVLSVSTPALRYLGFLPFAVLSGLWQARKQQLEQWESYGVQTSKRRSLAGTS